MVLERLGEALALALVIEGLLPLIAPQGWRKGVTSLMGLSDGQLRVVALVLIGAGLLLLQLLR